MSSLEQRHVEYLKVRAVGLDVAEEADLRSVSQDRGAELLGRRQPLPATGLAIPYPNVEPDYWRIRLDGGSVRYMAPRGREVPLYVPPGVDCAGSDPLHVVESPIKALALTAAGFPAVGLGGTGTTLFKDSGGGRRLNSSWSVMSLRGRVIVVVFDANRIRNLSVLRDEARLVHALTGAGAEVRVAQLPPDPGPDAGPDDFLARAGSDALREVISAAVAGSPRTRLADLDRDDQESIAALLDDSSFWMGVRSESQGSRRLLRAEGERLGIGKREWDGAIRDLQRRIGAAQADKTRAGVGLRRSPYCIDAGRHCLFDGLDDDGEEKLLDLSNFVAQIDEEVILDNDQEEQREWVVSASLADGRALPAVRMTTEDFRLSTWPLEKWGAQARTPARAGTAEHLRVAIFDSSTPPVRRVLTHTGWRVDERQNRPNPQGPTNDRTWYFAHGGGAVGRDDVQVELDGNLGRYRLPTAVENPLEAIQTSLELIRVAPPRVVYPILAAVYRAPLCSVRPFDSTLWCYGQTGTKKSTVVALFVSHFGRFTTLTHAASWEDTAASIENTLFLGKDVIAVIDDFVPRGAASWDSKRMMAERIVRSVGNQSSRGRMRADLTARVGRPPRGLVVATGEDLPSGESILARTLPIDFHPNDVNVGALTELQGRAARLPHAMAAYLEWLAPQMDDLWDRLEDRFKWWRQDFARSANHSRTPEVLANLMLGIEMFVEFAQDAGAMTPQRGRDFTRDAAIAFRSLGDEQGEQTRQLDPVNLFLEGLSACLQSGSAELVEDHTEALERFGAAAPIGWRRGPRDPGYVYLEPRTTFSAVCRSLREQGESMPVKQSSLWSRMKDRGLLLCADDRCKVQRTLGGRRPWVVALREEAIPGITAEIQEAVGQGVRRLSLELIA
jgi:hypothetical protein